MSSFYSLYAIVIFVFFLYILDCDYNVFFLLNFKIFNHFFAVEYLMHACHTIGQ